MCQWTLFALEGQTRQLDVLVFFLDNGALNSYSFLSVFDTVLSIDWASLESSLTWFSSRSWSHNNLHLTQQNAHMTQSHRATNPNSIVRPDWKGLLGSLCMSCAGWSPLYWVQLLICLCLCHGLPIPGVLYVWWFCSSSSMSHFRGAGVVFVSWAALTVSPPASSYSVKTGRLQHHIFSTVTRVMSIPSNAWKESEKRISPNVK